jgi:hypothetical protein
MDVRVGSPVAAASPATTRLKNKRMTMSLEAFRNLDKTAHVDEPLTSAAVLDRFDSAACAIRPDPREFYKEYRGRIIANFKGPQYLLIKDVAEHILFSQREVSDFNQGKTCDYPLGDLADALFLEFKRDILGSGDGALDVVAMGDEKYASLDNRRLLIAKKIGAVDRMFGIWIRVHGSDDLLSEGLQRRFMGARTWGEAVQIRINNEKAKFGYSSNPRIMTNNAKNQRVDAESQLISLSVMDVNLSALNPADAARIGERKVNGTIKI